MDKEAVPGLPEMWAVLELFGDQKVAGKLSTDDSPGTDPLGGVTGERAKSMMNRTYQILRNDQGQVQCLVHNPHKPICGERLRPVRPVIYHSPSGFECGYNGSGPADLALSILADFFDVDRQTIEERLQGWHGEHGIGADCVAALYQAFKEAFIATIKLQPGASHYIPEGAIVAFVAAHGGQETPCAKAAVKIQLGG